MHLEPGSRLASYEIVALLGAGGMGEVYRARDPRLGRDVAIKVLPAAFASDADRLHRFEQEARAAGMLNHPNLLTVFELGVHEGAPYIVTELLEGETLRERLTGAAALPARKAIDLAMQIAHGLAAAHEKGIVHRDLKPENLFVTRDGRVKILDFGLAKLLSAAPSPQESTMKMQHTAPGAVMGTAGYMAPEQVRGEEVDPRADIFAFGAILYEMLSGRRAFARDSSVETMSAILKDDPPELSASGRAVPPSLQKIVDHCLEKSPAARFQSAKDVAFHLETITTISDSGAVRPLGGVRRSRMTAIAVTAVIALALLAGAAAWIAVRRRAPSQPVMHQLTFRRGTVRSARFAPDGETVIYGASWDGDPLRMFQTRINSFDAAPVALPDGDVLSIAPSGEMAVSIGRKFDAWTSYGTLATASLLGGTPRSLLETVNCADYTPDGKELAVVWRSGDHDRIEWPIGKLLAETKGYFSHLRVSRDGQSVAFLDHPFFGDNRGNVVIMSRRGEKKVLVRDWASLEGMAWSADGSEVWFTGDRDGTVGNLEMYGVDLHGKVRPVWHVPSNLILLDVARDGRVLLTSGEVGGSTHGMRAADPRERDLTFLSWANTFGLTPDGNAIIGTSYGAGAGPYYSTYLRPFDGTPIRLGEGQACDVSPDGKFVATIRFSDPPQLLVLPTGAGSTRVANTNGVPLSDARWLPDGRLVAGGVRPGEAPRFAIIDPNGGPPHPIAIRGSVPASDGFLVSPDGKWIVVHGWTRQEIAMAPIGGGDAVMSPLKMGPHDQIAGFAEDGKVYVAHLDGRTFHVDAADLLTGQASHVRDVPLPDLGGVAGRMYLFLSRDAKTYVTDAFRLMTSLYEVEGLR